MKVKELIKQLQKADPTGELHVRICGKMPTSCESKPGYYDGPYMYRKMESNDLWNDKFIISTKGKKIDIHTLDEEDIIWDSDGDYSMFEFDFTYLDNGGNIKRWQDRFEKISKEYKACNKQIMEEQFYRMMKDYVLQGWKIKQSKEKLWSRTWYKNDQELGIVQGMFKIIRDSGMFEIYNEDENYFYYKLKSN